MVTDYFHYNNLVFCWSGPVDFLFLKFFRMYCISSASVKIGSSVEVSYKDKNEFIVDFTSALKLISPISLFRLWISSKTFAIKFALSTPLLIKEPLRDFNAGII